MKKLLFQLVFWAYLHVVLLKFHVGALVGWVIQFRIQRVPTQHTFGGPRSTKNETPTSHFFMYFSFFVEWGPPKVCRVGTRWMRNWIPHPTASPIRNLSKTTWRYVENTSWKSSFSLFNYFFIFLHFFSIFLLF